MKLMNIPPSVGPTTLLFKKKTDKDGKDSIHGHCPREITTMPEMLEQLNLGTGLRRMGGQEESTSRRIHCTESSVNSVFSIRAEFSDWVCNSCL